MMTKTWLTVLFCLMISGALTAQAKGNSNDKCLKTRAKIEKIQSKMRQGYTNKQGEKYRKKLKKLYKDEFKYCI